MSVYHLLMMPRCAVGCDSVLFLCATSLTTDDAPWIGFQLEHSAHSGWVGVTAGTGVSTTSMPQLFQERSAAKRSFPGYGNRSDQLQPPDGCPTGEGPTSNPDRRTGPRTEDLNTPPVRSALPAESNLKSAAAAFPRGRPGGERINPFGQTRATGTVPPRFLWRETSEKPDNAIIINPPGAENKGFGPPSAQSVPSSSYIVPQKFS